MKSLVSAAMTCKFTPDLLLQLQFSFLGEKLDGIFYYSTTS